MANRNAYELLLDSEANLRLIGTVLSDEIRDLDGAAAVPTLRMLPAAETEPRRAGGSTAATDSVLERLRGSRVLLQETATRIAPAGDTDALDRALSLVDEMETAESTDGAAMARAAIRKELGMLALRLQSHDDAAMQIERASALLGELAERLLRTSAPDPGGA